FILAPLCGFFWTCYSTSCSHRRLRHSLGTPSGQPAGTPTLVSLLELPVSEVGKVAFDGGCGCHHWTDQVGASSASLAAFEVAVACRSAGLAGFKDVRVHA